jgi:hypothetical protein
MSCCGASTSHDDAGTDSCAFWYDTGAQPAAAAGEAAAAEPVAVAASAAAFVAVAGEATADGGAAAFVAVGGEAAVVAGDAVSAPTGPIMAAAIAAAARPIAATSQPRPIRRVRCSFRVIATAFRDLAPAADAVDCLDGPGGASGCGFR